MPITITADTFAELLSVAQALAANPDIGAKLDQLIQMVSTLQTEEVTVAADLTTLTNDVANNTTVVNSAITLIQGLASQLSTAIAALPDPTQLTELQAALETSDTALANAVAANTPAAPPAPPPAPAPPPPPGP